MLSMGGVEYVYLALGSTDLRRCSAVIGCADCLHRLQY